MTTTGTLPAAGTAEGRAALEQEARGHGFPDARAYTEAYAAGRVDTRGVGDRPGDPRTGFGQIQAYAKAAAIWGILLVEYAALSPAGKEPTGAADHALPDVDDPAHEPEPPARSRDNGDDHRTPEPATPRPDTTFQSVAATVAVVDMADGEAFDGVHSLDLVTPPVPAEHGDPESGSEDLAFGTATLDGAGDQPSDRPDDEPVADGPVFGAGFPLVAGELGEPDGDHAEAFDAGDPPAAGDALPEPATEAVVEDGDADMETHVLVPGSHDNPADHPADHPGSDEAHPASAEVHDVVEPDPAHDSHIAADSGGESFT